MIVTLSLLLACQDPKEKSFSTRTADSGSVALSSRIQGRVLDDRGVGVADAVVRVGEQTFYTDAAGFFLSGELSSGEVRFSVQAEGTSGSAGKLSLTAGAWSYADLLVIRDDEEPLEQVLGGAWTGEAGGVSVRLGKGTAAGGGLILRAALLDEPQDALALPALGALESGEHLRLVTAAEVQVLEEGRKVRLDDPATLTLPLMTTLAEGSMLYGYDPELGLWSEVGPVAITEGRARGEVPHFSWYGVGAPADESQCVRLTLSLPSGRVLSGRELLVFDLEALAVGRFETDRFGLATVTAAAGSTVEISLAYGPYSWSSGPLTLPEEPADEVGCLELGRVRPTVIDQDDDAFPASVWGGPDCADDDPARNPDAEEIWYDGVDQDCQGDDDQDQDGDQDRALGSGGTDCDDEDPGRSSLLPEVCDEADQDEDCDGASDEADPEGPIDGQTWSRDEDGDCWGGGEARIACADPNLSAETVSSGACTLGRWVLPGGDCQDSGGSTPEIYYPGAPEPCGTDEDYNCDGMTSEDGEEDTDGDGVLGCGEGVTDCDDGRPDISPEAVEECDDGEDDDCDGLIDETEDGPFYVDADMDGYGDPARSTTSCERSGLVRNALDCDDADFLAFPGAAWAEGDACMTDHDRDGYGDMYASGDVTPGTDCDDHTVAVHPHNPLGELCSTAYDDDCDGEINEASAWDSLVFSLDADGDGVGSAASVTLACEAPGDGYVLGPDAEEDGDCDDEDPEISPLAVERCATVGVDDDCDGRTDEVGAADEVVWYTDGDGDGFGDPAEIGWACSAPDGMVAVAGDCDDGDPEVQSESSWYVDADGDGYGDDSAAVVVDCVDPGGRVSMSGDCDDVDATVNPGAVEVCDGFDVDCDGMDTAMSVATEVGEGLFTSVQDAIDAAVDGDEICVAPGQYAGNIDFLGKAITVRGSGGAEETELGLQETEEGPWNVVTMQSGEGPETVLQSLTIAWGIASDDYFNPDGGGVYLRDASPVLFDVVVRDSYATGNGGGIYAEGGAPWFERVTITGNYAEKDGGGIYLKGSSATIIDSSFDENSANGRGAGIHLYESPASLSELTLTANVAMSGGGGIALEGDCGADLTNITMQLNESHEWWGAGLHIDSDLSSTISDMIIIEGRGGGIYVENAETIFERFTISDDTGGGVWVIGGAPRFTGPFEVARNTHYGGFRLEETDAQISNGTIEGNYWALGGGIEIEGGFPAIESVVIKDNEADNLGGGAYINGGSASFTNVTFQSNIAPQGGGVYIEGEASPTFIGCNFDQNTAQDMSHGSDNGLGGGMLVYLSSVTVADATISANVAGNDGGGVYMLLSSGEFSNVDIYDNRSDARGGGVFSEDSQLSVQNTRVYDNVAQKRGGGIFALAGSLVLSESEIYSNALEGASSEGGGVYVQSGEATIFETSVDNNSSTTGGGLYLYGAYVHLGNSSIFENVATDSGGGIYAEVSELYLSDSSLSDNSVAVGDYGGGGLCSISGIAELEGVTISGNSAYDGGGASIVYSETTMSDVALFGNEAALGGGMQLYCDSCGFDNVVVSDNSAIYGGGLMIGPIDDTSDYSGLIVEQNSASQSGGGAYLLGPVSVSGLEVRQNTAGETGGGLQIEDAEDFWLHDAVIEGNTAPDGGGVWVYGVLMLSETLLSDNTAERDGGGIYQAGGYVGLQSSIVLGNQAGDQGGAVYQVRPNSLDSWNSVIAANTATEGGAIYEESGNTLFLNNTSFYRNTSSASDDTSIVDGDTDSYTSVWIEYAHAYGNDDDSALADLDSTGDAVVLTSDPLFTDTTSTDPLDWILTLSSSSPLIDAGDPDIIDPDGSRSDIGAFGGPGAAEW